MKGKTTQLVYKGKVLTPLTPAEAQSLDKCDQIKYIGPAGTRSYGIFGRSVLLLREKPETSKTAKGHFTIGIYSEWEGVVRCSIKNWALAKRGDQSTAPANRAKRFIPMNLEGFKRDLARLADRTKKRIDKLVKELPLHRKMEVFKSLNPDAQTLYDFIYKDLDVVIGLKKEE